MLFSDFHFPDCPKNIICFHGDNITENLIEQCFKLDDEFFSEAFLYERSKMKDLILNHNELCFIFFDLEQNKVIGYNFLVLLKDSSYDLYLNGNISYFTMGEIDFAKLGKDKSATLFYLSTAYAVGNKIPSLQSFSQNCIYYILIDLYKKFQIKISNVLYDVVNDFDLKYVTVLKMNFYKNTKYNSKIYTLKFIPKTFYPFAQNANLLQYLYENK